jgi:hypothetical protein
MAAVFNSALLHQLIWRDSAVPWATMQAGGAKRASQAAAYDNDTNSRHPHHSVSGVTTPSSSSSGNGSSSGGSHIGAGAVNAGMTDGRQQQKRRLLACSDSAGANIVGRMPQSTSGSKPLAEAAETASACAASTKPRPEPPSNPFVTARGKAWSGTLPNDEVAEIRESPDLPAVQQQLLAVQVRLQSCRAALIHVRSDS